jgi:hypothetical protein
MGCKAEAQEHERGVQRPALATHLSLPLLLPLLCQ